MEVNLFKQCVDSIPAINTGGMSFSNISICLITLSALYLFVRLSQTKKLLNQEKQSVIRLNNALIEEKKYSANNIQLINEIFLRININIKSTA